jgi:hypothetical protein
MNRKLTALLALAIFSLNGLLCFADVEIGPTRGGSFHRTATKERNPFTGGRQGLAHQNAAVVYLSQNNSAARVE